MNALVRTAAIDRCLSPVGAGLLALTAIAACASDARTPLSRTFDSPERAAGAVLGGIAARNPDVLLDLALDEHEFRRVVWPELPSSRPEVGLPVEYAWGRLHRNSRAQLSLTLAEHGGRRYELVAVHYRGGTTRYSTYAVHRDTELVVRDSSGTVRTVRLFGSLIERNGRWKVFSYVVD